MLSKCANPACSAQFHYWHEGQLYRVERHSPRKLESVEFLSRHPEHARLAPRVEFFWLCERCAARMTLTFEEDEGVKLNPRAQQLRPAS